MAYLELHHLSKNFGDVHAVIDACIEIEKGSFFTFLGPSGCGKTTTLRMIAGFETPSDGKIIMDSQDITDLAPEKKEIGMVFQNYALFPHMTVAENVAYGLKVKKKSKSDVQEQVTHYLNLVGLKGYEKRKITQLSGGEQQRVALARSLAIEPKILLLDEPLSNLDAKMRDEMRFELKRLQHTLKITMLYVTHDQSEALVMSDQIAVFNKGKIQQIGAPDEIYNRPCNQFVANFVGETNLISAVAAEGQTIELEGGVKVDVCGTCDAPKFVSIRTSNLFLHRPEKAPNVPNLFPAKVMERQFNGMTTHYALEMGGLLLNAVVCNSSIAESFQKGDAICVSIDPTSIVLLKE